MSVLFYLSIGTVQIIVHRDILQRENAGQQVVLLMGKKHRRFETDLPHLLRFEQGDEFLGSIVTGDDTYVHHVTTHW